MGRISWIHAGRCDPVRAKESGLRDAPQLPTSFSQASGSDPNACQSQNQAYALKTVETGRFLTTRRLASALVFVLMTLCSVRSPAITVGCPDRGDYPMNGCSLPGLIEGSFPFFYQQVNVRYKQSKKNDKFRIKARFLKRSPDSSLYVDPEDVLAISKTKLKFKAKVKNGVAIGRIKIKGRIDKLDIKDKLMTAELEGRWAADGTLIGFNTKNIQCHAAIDAYLGGDGCTANEVIYLNLLDPIGPDAGERKIRTSGIAVTSVPVPAAAWLFGSGLIALATAARRRWFA